MSWFSFGRRSAAKELRARCATYLKNGPPEHMVDYVPNSLTEIIIAHGANGEALDAELSEIAGIIVSEPQDHFGADAEIRQYMQEGVRLVAEVLRIHGKHA